MNKTVVLDFDGTICAFKFPDVGEPIPGVKEALEKIKEMGYRIVIHSVRTASYWNSGDENFRPCQEHIKIIEEYMEKHHLPYDDIWLADKPIAIAYVDDRAVRFKGSWKEVIDEIVELEMK